MAEGDTRIQADVSVVEFLNALTGEEKQKLYRDPWTAQTVFQALPALAQQYVLKALFARRPVPQSVSEAWVRMDCAAEHERSIRTLRNLCIMRKCSVPGTEERHYALDGGFQHCLLLALGSAAKRPWEEERAKMPHLPRPSLTALKRSARERWERVLSVVAGLPEGRKRVVPTILSLLVSNGLTKGGRGGAQAAPKLNLRLSAPAAPRPAPKPEAPQARRTKATPTRKRETPEWNAVGGAYRAGREHLTMEEGDAAASAAPAGDDDYRPDADDAASDDDEEWMDDEVDEEELEALGNKAGPARKHSAAAPRRRTRQSGRRRTPTPRGPAGTDPDARGLALQTAKGWSFLLQPLFSQLRFIVRHLFGEVRRQGMSAQETLSLLFALSMCRPGLDYPCTALTDGQRALLPLFEELSLIVRGTGSAADRFFPTPHGVDLLFGTARSEVETSLRAVVETNFRLYVYTESPVYVAVVRKFAELKARLPNFTALKIKRSTVQHAFDSGITAGQIIHFLESHAHTAALRRQGGAVPDDVKDQIRVWELERYRLRPLPVAVLRFKRGTQEEGGERELYDKAVEMARARNALVWHSEGASAGEQAVEVEEEDEESLDVVLRSEAYAEVMKELH